jgi:hypothetical protein
VGAASLDWLGSAAGVGCVDGAESLVACGGRAGGFNGVAALDEPVACVLEAPFFALVLTAFSVLPGNAFAATSLRTPVTTTLPAISQRFVRRS